MTKPIIYTDHHSTTGNFVVHFQPSFLPSLKQLLQTVGRSAQDISSVVLIKSVADREVYIKSKAVLKVMEQLNVPLRVASVIGTPIPPFIRDRMYDVVANNRYSLLGKRDICRVAGIATQPESNQYYCLCLCFEVLMFL